MVTQSIAHIVFTTYNLAYILSSRNHSLQLAIHYQLFSYSLIFFLSFGMDVSISLDHPHVIFTNGDTISGNVTIYSPTNTTKISKIIASLVGESVLTLTDKMGLLMDRKQQDRHRVRAHTMALSTS
jgi:hypothetical protein